MRKKIFVTKQGGIGDVILATPILSELKNNIRIAILHL